MQWDKIKRMLEGMNDTGLLLGRGKKKKVK